MDPSSPFIGGDWYAADVLPSFTSGWEFGSLDIRSELRERSRFLGLAGSDHLGDGFTAVGSVLVERFVARRRFFFVQRRAAGLDRFGFGGRGGRNGRCGGLHGGRDRRGRGRRRIGGLCRGGDNAGDGRGFGFFFALLFVARRREHARRGQHQQQRPDGSVHGSSLRVRSVLQQNRAFGESATRLGLAAGGTIALGDRGSQLRARAGAGAGAC